MRHLPFLFLAFVSILFGQSNEGRSKFVVGRYVQMVPGSAASLELSNAGGYLLSRRTFDGQKVQVTMREKGAWRFEGCAIVLSPTGPADMSPDMQSFRRLFPLEEKGGDLVLVSPMQRIGGGEYAFVTIFRKEASVEPPNAMPRTVPGRANSAAEPSAENENQGDRTPASGRSS